MINVLQRTYLNKTQNKIDYEDKNSELNDPVEVVIMKEKLINIINFSFKIVKNFSKNYNDNLTKSLINCYAVYLNNYSNCKILKITKTNNTITNFILNILKICMWSREFRELTKQTLDKTRRHTSLTKKNTFNQNNIRNLYTARIIDGITEEDIVNLGSPRMVNYLTSLICENVLHYPLINESGEFSYGKLTSQPYENSTIPLNNDAKYISIDLKQLPDDFFQFFQRDKTINYSEKDLLENIKLYAKNQTNILERILIEKNKLDLIKKSTYKNNYKQDNEIKKIMGDLENLEKTYGVYINPTILAAIEKQINESS